MLLDLFVFMAPLAIAVLSFIMMNAFRMECEALRNEAAFWKERADYMSYAYEEEKKKVQDYARALSYRSE